MKIVAESFVVSVRLVSQKNPSFGGAILQLDYVSKERGFIKYCGAKIIIIFVPAKKNIKMIKYQTLEKFASKPRINRFFVATGTKTGAKNLYKANLLVSQAFYPILNLMEIFLRNSLYASVEAYFSNSDWIISEKNGFMSDHSLAASGYYLKNSVINAENKMLRKGITVTAGKVLAEQSFGFWVSLFEPAHYRLIGGSVIHSFPHKPPHINRKAFFLMLSKIRDFRNRIYHNEPVCFSGALVDFSYSRQIKDDIFDLLDWMEPVIKKYVKRFDNIDEKISLF